MEFLDLDSTDSDDPIEQARANSAFRQALQYMEQKNDPFRIVIGVWILRACLDYAQASRILYAFDCYKEVPYPKRKANLRLAQYLLEFYYNNPGKRIDPMPGNDTFIYHTNCAMRTMMAYYTDDEQDIILSKISTKISRSRG